MNEPIHYAWAGDDPLYIDCHDNQWGRPVHDDGKLFEMLILEGMQAGLSWITTIAYSVEKDFSVRIKDMRRVAKALAGVIACTD